MDMSRESSFPWKEDWYPILDSVSKIDTVTEFENNIDNYRAQIIAYFSNGYGISIVRHDGSYGYPKTFESAVLHENKKDRGVPLCYATEITDDVVGWMTPEKVVAMAEAIAALPRNDDCDHAKPDNWFMNEEESEYGEEADIGSMFSSLLTMLGRSTYNVE